MATAPAVPPQLQTELIVHSRSPFNAEPAPGRLCRHWLTPAEDFYIRSHGSVPRLDEPTHRLRVAGQVRHPLDLSMAELRRKRPVWAV